MGGDSPGAAESLLRGENVLEVSWRECPGESVLERVALLSWIERSWREVLERVSWRESSVVVWREKSWVEREVLVWREKSSGCPGQGRSVYCSGMTPLNRITALHYIFADNIDIDGDKTR